MSETAFSRLRISVLEGLKAFVLGWLVAPRVAARFITGGERNNISLSLSTSFQAATLESLLWAERGQIHWIPVERCVTPIGTAYSARQNPLVCFLESGFQVMKDYYEVFQPTNSMETVGLASKRVIRAGLSGVFRPPWSYIGVDLSGGAQFWGPRKVEAIEYDASTLRWLARSIKRRGYIVGLNPIQPIPGFRMLIDDVSSVDTEYRVIVQGNHRVAVMAALGWTHIPMAVGAQSPLGIRLSDMPKWPGVVDGTYSQEEASQFFSAFFRSPEISLFQGWPR